MNKISIYLDDGVVFEYEVSSETKAREHTHAIVMTGYRSCSNGELTHYPPHRISKVKVTGGGIDTMFEDTVRGT